MFFFLVETRREKTDRRTKKLVGFGKFLLCYDQRQNGEEEEISEKSTSIFHLEKTFPLKVEKVQLN